MPSTTDNRVIFAGLMITSLAAVGYGFSQGWFSPTPTARPAKPAEPTVQLILDTEAPPPRKPAHLKVPVGEPSKSRQSSEESPEAPAGPMLTLQSRKGADEAPRPKWQDPAAGGSSGAPGGSSAPAPFGLGPAGGTGERRPGLLTLQEARPRQDPAREASAAPLRYLGSTRGRWIDNLAQDGSRVELDDGSVWDVSPMFREVVRSWDLAQNVSITPSSSAAYPYRISVRVRGADVRLSRPPTGRNNLPEGEEMPVEQ